MRANPIRENAAYTHENQSYRCAKRRSWGPSSATSMKCAIPWRTGYERSHARHMWAEAA